MRPAGVFMVIVYLATGWWPLLLCACLLAAAVYSQPVLARRGRPRRAPASKPPMSALPPTAAWTSQVDLPPIPGGPPPTLTVLYPVHDSGRPCRGCWRNHFASRCPPPPGGGGSGGLGQVEVWGPWVPDPDGGEAQIEHLGGVPWYRQPVPLPDHSCHPVTRGWAGPGRLSRVERCACGGARYSGGPWMDRNQRQGEQ
jgi:hypothetical protein